MNSIDILIFSLLFAITTFLHNRLYSTNKSVFIMIVVLFCMSIGYRLFPGHLWQEIHVFLIISTVWALIIYSFYLKHNSNLFKKGKKKCRRKSDV